MMSDKPYTWLFLCLIWTGPVWGMASVAKVDCPLQVKATVQDVGPAPSTQSGMAMQHISFTVDEALKGDAGNELGVDILRYGPLSVEIGKQYVVQMNDGKLCSLEAI